MTTRETVNARLEELEHGQEDHHARIAAMEAKPSTTGPPINEAGITATFAAIFAALDSLLDRVATLESARIAAPTAPESTETGPGVPMEPGNATRPLTLLDPHDKDGIVQTNANGVAAALRMYRKVQALTVVEACGIMRVTYELAAPEVTALLAWLKEGEA